MAYPGGNTALQQIQEYLQLRRQQDPDFLKDESGNPIELSSADGRWGPRTRASLEAWIKEQGLEGKIDINDPNSIRQNMDTIWHTMRVDFAFNEPVKEQLEAAARDGSLSRVQRGMLNNMLNCLTPAQYIEHRETFEIPESGEAALSATQKALAGNVVDFLKANGVTDIPGIEEGNPIDTVAEFNAVRKALQDNREVLRDDLQRIADNPTEYLSESAANQAYIRQIQSALGMYSASGQFATRIDGDLGPNGSSAEELKETSHTLGQVRKALGLDTDNPGINIDTVPAIEEKPLEPGDAAILASTVPGENSRFHIPVGPIGAKIVLDNTLRGGRGTVVEEPGARAAEIARLRQLDVDALRVAEDARLARQTAILDELDEARIKKINAELDAKGITDPELRKQIIDESNRIAAGQRAEVEAETARRAQLEQERLLNDPEMRGKVGSHLEEVRATTIEAERSLITSLDEAHAPARTTWLDEEVRGVVTDIRTRDVAAIDQFKKDYLDAERARLDDLETQRVRDLETKLREAGITGPEADEIRSNQFTDAQEARARIEAQTKTMLDSETRALLENPEMRGKVAGSFDDINTRVSAHLDDLATQHAGIRADLVTIEVNAMGLKLDAADAAAIKGLSDDLAASRSASWDALDAARKADLERALTEANITGAERTRILSEGQQAFDDARLRIEADTQRLIDQRLNALDADPHLRGRVAANIPELRTELQTQFGQIVADQKLQHASFARTEISEVHAAMTQSDIRLLDELEVERVAAEKARLDAAETARVQALEAELNTAGIQGEDRARILREAKEAADVTRADIEAQTRAAAQTERNRLLGDEQYRGKAGEHIDDLRTSNNTKLNELVEAAAPNQSTLQTQKVTEFVDARDTKAISDFETARRTSTNEALSRFEEMHATRIDELKAALTEAGVTDPALRQKIIADTNTMMADIRAQIAAADDVPFDRTANGALRGNLHNELPAMAEQFKTDLGTVVDGSTVQIEQVKTTAIAALDAADARALQEFRSAHGDTFQRALDDFNAAYARDRLTFENELKARGVPEGERTDLLGDFDDEAKRVRTQIEEMRTSTALGDDFSPANQGLRGKLSSHLPQELTNINSRVAVLSNLSDGAAGRLPFDQFKSENLTRIDAEIAADNRAVTEFRDARTQALETARTNFEETFTERRQTFEQDLEKRGVPEAERTKLLSDYDIEAQKVRAQVDELQRSGIDPRTFLSQNEIPRGGAAEALRVQTEAFETRLSTLTTSGAEIRAPFDRFNTDTITRIDAEIAADNRAISQFEDARTQAFDTVRSNFEDAYKVNKDAFETALSQREITPEERTRLLSEYEAEANRIRAELDRIQGSGFDARAHLANNPSLRGGMDDILHDRLQALNTRITAMTDLSNGTAVKASFDDIRNVSLAAIDSDAAAIEKFQGAREQRFTEALQELRESSLENRNNLQRALERRELPEKEINRLLGDYDKKVDELRGKIEELRAAGVDPQAHLNANTDLRGNIDSWLQTQLRETNTQLAAFNREGSEVRAALDSFSGDTIARIDANIAADNRAISNYESGRAQAFDNALAEFDRNFDRSKTAFREALEARGLSQKEITDILDEYDTKASEAKAKIEELRATDIDPQAHLRANFETSGNIDGWLQTQLNEVKAQLTAFNADTGEARTTLESFRTDKITLIDAQIAADSRAITSYETARTQAVDNALAEFNAKYDASLDTFKETLEAKKLPEDDIARLVSNYEAEAEKIRTEIERLRTGSIDPQAHLAAHPELRGQIDTLLQTQLRELNTNLAAFAPDSNLPASLDTFRTKALAQVDADLARPTAVDSFNGAAIEPETPRPTMHGAPIERGAAFADDASTGLRTLGRALSFGKVLFVAGAVAITVEVVALEEAAAEAFKNGKLGEGDLGSRALLEYQGIMAAHAAQATVDPSLVVGELGVQEIYDAWARSHGLSPEVTESLRPSSVIDMVGSMFKSDSLSVEEQRLNEIMNRIPDELPADAPDELKKLVELRNQVQTARTAMSDAYKLPLTDEARELRLSTSQGYATALEAYHDAFYKTLLPADAPAEFTRLNELRNTMIEARTALENYDGSTDINEIMKTYADANAAYQDYARTPYQDGKTIGEAYSAAVEQTQQGLVDYLRGMPPTQRYLDILKAGWEKSITQLTAGGTHSNTEAARVQTFNNHFGIMTPEMAYEYGISKGVIPAGSPALDTVDEATKQQLLSQHQSQISTIQQTATMFHYYQSKGMVDIVRHNDIDDRPQAVTPTIVVPDNMPAVEIDYRSVRVQLDRLQRLVQQYGGAAGNELNAYDRIRAVQNALRDDSDLGPHVKDMALLSAEIVQLSEAEFTLSVRQTVTLSAISERFPGIDSYEEFINAYKGDEDFRWKVELYFPGQTAILKHHLEQGEQAQHLAVHLKHMAESNGIAVPDPAALETQTVQAARLAEAAFQSISGLSEQDRQMYARLFENAKTIADHYVGEHGQNLSPEDQETLKQHITNLAQFGPIEVPGTMDVRGLLAYGQETGLLNLKQTLATALNIDPEQLQFDIEISDGRINSIKYINKAGEVVEADSKLINTLEQRLAWLAKYQGPLSEFQTAKGLPALNVNPEGADTKLPEFRELVSTGALHQTLRNAIPSAVTENMSEELKRLVELNKALIEAQSARTELGFGGTRAQRKALDDDVSAARNRLSGALGEMAEGNQLLRVINELNISPHKALQPGGEMSTLEWAFSKVAGEGEQEQIQRILAKPAETLNDPDKYRGDVRFLAQFIEENPGHPQTSALRETLKTMFDARTQDSRLFSALSPDTVTQATRVLEDNPTVLQQPGVTVVHQYTDLHGP